MKQILPLFVFLSIAQGLHSQNPTGMFSTNPEAEQIMLGLYDPAVYGNTDFSRHDEIVAALQADISPDSLKSLIIKLASFHTRNTGSDTLSSETGIGAARRWIYSRFEEYSAAAGNRLIPSYLQFNENICKMNVHRDIIAVLPGTDTTDKSVILVEAHMDSRCKDVCDTACQAMGVEDNASGTALVLELARVMSKHRYKRTIVFMLTVAEEQSLNGSTAFAKYATQKKIQIRAVQNNDVIGGIICGKTSSSPSCPGLNDIDSTQVRIFSLGSFDSPHKSLARFIKLEYKEELLPIVNIPMQITIMSSEDRNGRGGDHQPFRAQGFTAVRFTSANEHGNANASDPNYTDRQHTETDVLGVDTDGDAVVDSFFVDFNYLARNAAINGTSLAMAAIGPGTPSFDLSKTNGGLRIEITSQTQYPAYRVGVRTFNNDWDTVYTMTSLVDTIPAIIGKNHYVSVASVDADGVESLFSGEKNMMATDLDETLKPRSGIELLQNHPNPFDEATTISFYVYDESLFRKAVILVTDITGKLIREIPAEVRKGMNEVLYEHGFGVTGTFLYSLIVDNQTIATRQMVFTAN